MHCLVACCVHALIQICQRLAFDFPTGRFPGFEADLHLFGSPRLAFFVTHVSLLGLRSLPCGHSSVHSFPFTDNTYGALLVPNLGLFGDSQDKQMAARRKGPKGVMAFCQGTRMPAKMWGKFRFSCVNSTH